MTERDRRTGEAAYEQSLSWRVTRPLRAVGRATRAVRRRFGEDPPQAVVHRAGYDSWLDDLYGDELSRIDAACREGGPERFALFRDLGPDVWALLLTHEYDAYPNIRALLPDLPDPSIQEKWTGVSGVPLLPRVSRSTRPSPLVIASTAPGRCTSRASSTSDAAGGD